MGSEEACNICHMGSLKTTWKELDMQEPLLPGVHLFSTTAYSHRSLLLTPIDLFCTWPYWRQFSMDLMFQHVLKTGTLSAFTSDSLFMDIGIGNSLERQRSFLPLGQRTGLFVVR